MWKVNHGVPIAHTGALLPLSFTCRLLIMTLSHGVSWCTCSSVWQKPLELVVDLKTTKSSVTPCFHPVCISGHNGGQSKSESWGCQLSLMKKPWHIEDTTYRGLHNEVEVIEREGAVVVHLDQSLFVQDCNQLQHSLNKTMLSYLEFTAAQLSGELHWEELKVVPDWLWGSSSGPCNLRNTKTDTLSEQLHKQVTDLENMDLRRVWYFLANETVFRPLTPTGHSKSCRMVHHF